MLHSLGMRAERATLSTHARGLRRAVDAPAVRVAWQALWTSRLVVLVSGVLAVLSFGRATDWQGFDPARLTAPFGYFGNLLAAPFARWDSAWYLSIAKYDYASIAGAGQARAAFFPLYPLLIWLGSGFGASSALQLIAAFALSVVAFCGALYLLHRLVALEFDAQLARNTVWIVAWLPMQVAAPGGIEELP